MKQGGTSLGLDGGDCVISDICEEPAESLVLEMSPAALGQTNKHHSDQEPERE